MLEDKWAEKRDRWAWSIFLESNGVWWWIMKMGRVIVKRLPVIKNDAVHCVDRPSHERILSFVACNKVLLHWSLKSPGDSWKIQVRPPEPRKLKFGPGLTVLIQHYTQSLFNLAALKETGYTSHGPFFQYPSVTPLWSDFHFLFKCQHKLHVMFDHRWLVHFICHAPFIWCHCYRIEHYTCIPPTQESKADLLAMSTMSLTLLP